MSTFTLFEMVLENAPILVMCNLLQIKGVLIWKEQLFVKVL